MTNPKIILAKTAGFCMGVKRAVEMALAARENCPPPLCTLGQLIHNATVVAQLAAQGINVCENLPPRGTVIIRAHGVSPTLEAEIAKCGLTMIDATCPLVKKSQQIISDAATAGKYVLIVGDAEHAEVQGLSARAIAGGCVIGTLTEAENLATLPPAAIMLAQTTFSQNAYAALSAYLKNKFPQLKIYQTICAATVERQAEVQTLAETSDLLIIIGGKNSANTRRLAEVGERAGVKTLLIENATELNLDAVLTAKIIGVSAGASTPQSVIDKVLRRLTLPQSI